jgi:hypothetical protein
VTLSLPASVGLTSLAYCLVCFPGSERNHADEPAAYPASRLGFDLALDPTRRRQAGLFLRLLILARLLTPDDFGLVAIAVTSIGFFLSVTDVGMIPALVQGDEVDEKQYNAAWTVGVLRAAAIAVIVFFATGLIATVFAEPRAIPIIQVLALRPLLDALNSIKVADLTRRLQFRPLATYKLAEALVATLTSILLAASWGVWALVAGVLGRFADQPDTVLHPCSSSPTVDFRPGILAQIDPLWSMDLRDRHHRYDRELCLEDRHNPPAWNGRVGPFHASIPTGLLARRDCQ